MFCPNCGATVADNTTSCPKCGTQITRPQPVQGYGPIPGEIPTEGKATASMVLGILSVVCIGIFAGIPAIILGHMARKNIRSSLGRLKGDGMALAGIIMGYVSVAYTCVMLIIIAAIAIPNFFRARISANESGAASAVRTIATAEIQYQTTYPKVGYAPDLASMGGTNCNEPSQEHACLIAEPLGNQSCTGVHWCTKNGYRFLLQADDRQPHDSFVITAIPTEVNRSGSKNFCATSDGVIRYETAGSLKKPYTAEECSALRPVGE